MSVEETIEDVLEGNFTHAEARVENWWSGMPQWLRDFVSKAKTPQGQILTSVAEVGAQDVMNGGFTTASFLTAVSDMGAKLVAQEISFGQQELFAALNLAVNALKPPITAEAPQLSVPTP